jgi:hypothetical protein
MKSVYDKIDKLYANDTDISVLANEIRSELKEIKALLKDMNNPRRNKYKNKDYFTFVDELRKKLQADTEKEIYPELDYQGKRIGVNFKGFLYDKSTIKNVTSQEAFAIYEYFYAKKDEIDELIRMD